MKKKSLLAIAKEQQKTILGGKNPGGGGVFDAWCSLVCCDGTSYQYSGPVTSCAQAYSNAGNLCNSHGGVNIINCDCKIDSTLP